jgi:hypothetical protein
MVTTPVVITAVSSGSPRMSPIESSWKICPRRVFALARRGSLASVASGESSSSDSGEASWVWTAYAVACKSGVAVGSGGRILALRSVGPLVTIQFADPSGMRA